MNTDISKLHKAVFQGLEDHSKIPEPEKTNLYQTFCACYNLDPDTKPFEWINFEGAACMLATPDFYRQAELKRGKTSTPTV